MSARELPAAPQTVALYLAARADQGLKVTTLELTLTTISQAHLLGSYASPRSDRLVKETWKGIRRRIGVAKAKKDPLSAPDLRRIVDALPSGLIGLRDRALILLGFASGSPAAFAAASSSRSTAPISRSCPKASRPWCGAARPTKKAKV